MSRKVRQRGFTLGETLTALAIVGVGLSLAVPSLQSLTSSNRQATAVNDLVATMHLARSEAVMRNRHVTVCTSTDGESCGDEHWEQGWIAWVDDNGNGTREAAETLIDRVAGLAAQELSSAEFAHEFSYRPNGRPMGASPDQSTGEFAFCEPGADVAAKIVILRANGLPALSDRRRDGSPASCRKS